MQPGGECYITLGPKNTWGWKDTDWPIVDENTKLRQEDGPENNVPHFYADDELIRELFAQFNMISMKQIETFVQKPHEVKVFESWHYHVLTQKPTKATI